MNTVNLIGLAGNNITVKYTAAGLAIGEFSLATRDSWKGADGQWQESTEWHSIQLFDKLAERLTGQVYKGDRIFVSGKVETRTWEKDGVKHYKTQVRAKEILVEPRTEKPPSDDDIPL